MGQIVEAKRRRRRRRNSYIWMLSAGTVISALLYWEQTAVLFVISTLVVTGLLLVVAFADLEGRDRELNQPAETDAGKGVTESNLTTGARSPPRVVHRTPKRQREQLEGRS